ncbi:MAG: MarR family winged helix-turn-helix transcriptional regulator [Candidatus Phaeomarinobacter sp.]
METALKKTLALALDIDRFMRLIHVNLHPKAQAIDEQKVGPLGGMVLMTIAENERLSIQDLTRQLARDKAQMTRLIQLLERKELLLRTRLPDDARVSLVSLTSEGHALVASFQDALADVVEDLLSGVNAEERKQFSATLRKILMTQEISNDE